jgi:hypothetical protein
VVNRTKLSVGPYGTTANVYVKQRSRDSNFNKTSYVIFKYSYSSSSLGAKTSIL